MQPTPSVPALGLPEPEQFRLRRATLPPLVRNTHQRFALLRLVRLLLVVVGNYLRDQMVHVLLAEQHEVIQALLLLRLDKPLHERVCIR